MAQTIQEFFKRFPDDAACLAQVFESRYGQGYVCPNCQRSAKWYKIKATRAYACQWCGWHIHPTAGTLFEDTRTPLRLWFYAIYLFTTTRHGVPAKELQRQLGVTYKTAWRMGHEIRKHMAEVDGNPPLTGQVEADETYIGGVNKGAGRGRGLENKAILFGMVKRGGHLMTKVVESADRDTLMREIGHNVRRGSTIHTDEYKGYRGLAGRGYKHVTVNHSEGEYARKDGAGTNTIEGAFSRLKNSIRGTHVSVSPKHLPKYAGEFEYRYNRRKQPEKMIDELLSVFPPPDEE
jgi:transposase-like protein